jgi:RimJ/RimL family protein N-acetyltransferase
MNETEPGKVIFTTPRLVIQLATVHDAPLIHRLWTDPRVMRNVGFPKGIPITMQEVEQDIVKRGDSEFTQLLIVRIKSTGEFIGQCLMKLPDENGIAGTDVKLDPTYWGQRFGVEVKRGLLNHLFTHTDCKAVQATPNISNTASIQMQEAVGGVRVGESVYEFPDSMREFTMPVHCYIYSVSREAWMAQRATESLRTPLHETKTP